MNALATLHHAVFSRIERLAPAVLPTLARLIFAGTLLTYYVGAGFSKFGDGLFGFFQPSAGAYVQIFPKAFEAVGYDASQLGTYHYAVALAGTWGEIVLPILVVVGLFTRIAALGMICVVLVQSYVDIVGHGIGAADIGAWFDNLPTAVIVDQRAFWLFLLLYLVFRGAGPLSVDRVLANRAGERHA